MQRDEFSPKTKRTAAERAAFLCSNPRCNRPTIGPHSNPNKAKCLGIAAHICAAAPGGPRYDPKQTATQRKSIRNAIWACTVCGTEIDKDDSPYPVDVLREWKRIHEAFVGKMVKLGFVEALGLRGSDHQEQHLASRLISALSDRRVLYAMYDYETPSYCLKSSEIIRERLTLIRPDLRAHPELDARAKAMLDACSRFADEAGPLDLDRPLLRAGNEVNIERIIAALAGLRKTVGLHVMHLSEVYGLSLDEDLKSITPSADEVNDS